MAVDLSRAARGVKWNLARAWRRASRELRRIGKAPRRSPTDGPDPTNMVWIFGSARTGSTWLGAMMADVKGHTWWHEPMVGYLFGHLYFDRARARRKDEHFVLGGEKELWLGPVRRFVLDSVGTRFPGIGGDRYLVVKEPHGTLGSPLLLQALPESRVILLVRDPRDVISSKMDAAREGSWAERAQKGRGQQKKNTSADDRPDAFVRSQAKRYARLMEIAQLAFDAHEGPKVLVRYEDLVANTPAVMSRIYSTLGLPAEKADLARVVEKHAWENIPEREKGTGKVYRKGSPGGWVEDLTPPTGQSGRKRDRSRTRTALPRRPTLPVASCRQVVARDLSHSRGLPSLRIGYCETGCWLGSIFEPSMVWLEGGAWTFTGVPKS